MWPVFTINIYIYGSFAWVGYARMIYTSRQPIDAICEIELGSNILGAKIDAMKLSR